MVIVDTVQTKLDLNGPMSAFNQKNRVVFKMDMPEYLQHSACCLLWKKAIYIVGGELNGEWSSSGYKFDLKTFIFNKISNLETPLLKMASLAPANYQDLCGFFIAGLISEKDDQYNDGKRSGI